jgi:hypothetical protein
MKSPPRIPATREAPVAPQESPPLEPVVQSLAGGFCATRSNFCERRYPSEDRTPLCWTRSARSASSVRNQGRSRTMFPRARFRDTFPRQPSPPPLHRSGLSEPRVHGRRTATWLSAHAAPRSDPLALGWHAVASFSELGDELAKHQNCLVPFRGDGCGSSLHWDPRSP